MISLSLFHEHYGVRYLPRGLASWLFYLVSLLIVLVLPAVIGWAMKDFWIRTNVFYQTPSVAFSGRCAVRLTTTAGQERLWTCTDLFDEQLHGTSLTVLPYFSVFGRDADGDGRAETFHFLMTFPIRQALEASLYSAEAVSGGGVPGPMAIDSIRTITFLPEFTYSIRSRVVRVDMTAAPLLQYTNPAAAAAAASSVEWSGAPVCLVTRADLQFRSTERLIDSPYVSYTRVYADSPLELFAKQPADLLNLAAFAEHYTARNQSVVARPYSEAAGGLQLLAKDVGVVRDLGDDLDDLNSFTWSVQLRVSPAEVYYEPSVAEALKMAWVQYLAIACILQWCLWWMRGFLVKLGLLTTRAVFNHLKRS